MNKIYKRIFNEAEVENIIFDSANDVRDYIKLKSKEYGSKNEFLSSEEYHKLYPSIKYIFDIEKQDYKKKADQAMFEVGVDFGDRVRYVLPNMFGGIIDYTGVVVNKAGVPYVKYDKG